MDNPHGNIFPERLPISLLTGFLGSGKTTALNRLLRHPAMAGTAIIINEFGEIGIDHELVESSRDDTVLLSSGCLCCTIQGDLARTLHTLFLRRTRGQIPAFNRAVIETTGLADPAPILHTLMTDPLISKCYGLGRVVTTVDAALGGITLDRQPESVKQAAVADSLLLTKSDLVDDLEIVRLERRLHALNPGALILRSSNGWLSPADLFDTRPYNPKTKGLEVQRWLNVEAYGRGTDHNHQQEYRNRNERGSDPPHRGDVNRHDQHICAVCFTIEEPIKNAAFDLWLYALQQMTGSDLLRMKGIVNIDGLPGPVVIHGVQHIFHQPVILQTWPSSDRRTRIVLITRDIDEAMLRDSLGLLTADQFISGLGDAAYQSIGEPADV